MDASKTAAEQLDLERRSNGRVVVYSLETGKPYERAEDQALDLLRSGKFVTRCPDNVKSAPAADKPFELVPLTQLTDPAETERQAQFQELVDGGIPEDEARALVWAQG